MAELSVNRIAVIRYKDKSVACKDAISFGEMILDFETNIMYKVMQKIPANTPLETAIDNQSVEVVSAFDENGTYPKMSVGFAYDITPNEGDAIVDTTPFVWQTSGGESSIAPSSTGIIKKILGNSTLSYIENNKIVPFTGTQIVSRGTNLFNYQDTTKQIVGKKLNSDGTITADSDYTLFMVNVLAGVNNGNNGYVPVAKEGETLSGIGFNYLGFQITQPTEETSSVTLLTQSTHGNANSFLPEADGWIVFSLLTAKADCFSIQFAWSYSEFEFVAYEESVLALPSVCQQGLWGISGVCDEINNNGKYIKRIGVTQTATLSWEKWYQDIYNPSTGETEQVFYGYKSSSLQGIVKNGTTNVTNDYMYPLNSPYVDENGVYYFYCDEDTADNLAILTQGSNRIMYELANEETGDVTFSGLVNVWDFGDTRIFGAMPFNENVYGTISYVLPYSVEFLYSVNLRDVLRSIANSGVTFGTYGVQTSALYKSAEVINVNLNGSLTLSAGDIKKMMMFTLVGATNTIVLPNISTLGTNAFSCQCKIVQDATGSRNLYFVMDNGNGGTTNIKNPSEVDFSVGSANQSCIATLLYDGNGSWWIEATSYVD